MFSLVSPRCDWFAARGRATVDVQRLADVQIHEMAPPQRFVYGLAPTRP